MSQRMRLSNGTELDIIGCYGAKEYFRDVFRDTLEFRIDPANMTLDEADSLFSAENCETVVLIEYNNVEIVAEDGTLSTEVQATEFAHENYSVRVSLSKREETISLDDGSVQAMMMICVKMGQKSEGEIMAESYAILMGDME